MRVGGVIDRVIVQRRIGKPPATKADLKSAHCGA